MEESKQFDAFCKDINIKCIELQDAEKEYINEELAFEAYAYISQMKLEKAGDFLLFLSALNLLNTYVKQKDAKINYTFKNIPIDLYKVTRYEDNIVDIEHIQKTSNVKIEEVKIDNSTTVTKEIKVYTEDDHFSNVSDEVKKLYEILKERVLQLDDIDVEVKKMYIAFKGATNIIDIAFKKNEIRIYI